MDILSATGSRSLALQPRTEQVRVLDATKVEIQNLGPKLIYSGSAEGFDACVARAAFDLGIPYELWIPNAGYIDYYWQYNSCTGRNRIVQAREMMDRAAKIHYCCDGLYGDDPHSLIGARIHANHIRNHHLLKDGDHGLVYDPTSHGTKHGVIELNLHGVPWTEIK